MLFLGQFRRHPVASQQPRNLRFCLAVQLGSSGLGQELRRPAAADRQEQRADRLQPDCSEKQKLVNLFWKSGKVTSSFIDEL